MAVRGGLHCDFRRDPCRFREVRQCPDRGGIEEWRKRKPHRGHRKCPACRCRDDQTVDAWIGGDSDVGQNARPDQFFFASLRGEEFDGERFDFPQLRAAFAGSGEVEGGSGCLTRLPGGQNQDLQNFINRRVGGVPGIN